MTAMTPSRDDTGTTRPARRCAGCGQSFAPTGRQLHCSTTCRKRVFRSRHSLAAALAEAPLRAQPGPVGASGSRREHTVYECRDCGTRQLGVQRCTDCGLFASAVGLGGTCPSCDEPVTLANLGLHLRTAR